MEAYLSKMSTFVSELILLAQILRLFVSVKFVQKYIHIVKNHQVID